VDELEPPSAPFVRQVGIVLEKNAMRQVALMVLALAEEAQ
jgi:hypothetical protein